jgi:RimJ/RimL family protein N-acetyltransferase
LADPEELVIREVSDGDLDVFFDHQRDPEATRMAAFPAREREAFDAHWARILADETVVTRTIVVDGEVAGNLVSFLTADRRLVGYWIGREHWGKGVASRALAEFVRELPTRPLYAHVATSNRGSIRVLERNGFERAGEARLTEDGVEELVFELA